MKDLTDGKRVGKGSQIPAAGLELRWQKPERKVGALVLHPWPADKKSPAWPSGWTLEVRSGRADWKPLKNVQVTPLPAAAGGGKHPIPHYVLLRFPAVTARALRLKPTGKGTAGLTEVEAFRAR